MSTLPCAELTLFAHPAEHLRERGELRMTTIQIVWLNERGAAAVSIPWAQIQKDQYSKFNPTKAVDIVSLALTTVMTAKPVVFTLLGPSDSSRRELERIKVVIRDAVKNASRKRGSSRLAWLEADKALFKEYVELVRDGKVIDEEDFWRGKESMLSGFDSSRAVAEKGPLTALFADDTEVDDKGKMKVKINPEIIHNIFRLYPAVAKAYKDNVPEKMTEKEFWTKYFRSEYYARDKGSSAPDRISGRRAVLQTDDMFQRYDNEMAVAAIGHEKSATDVMAAKRLADMSSEINLISTYNDYHSSERLESFDVPTDISSNPVVSKYIRNTNLIVESMISVNGNSTASYCSGGKSSAELSEQFIDYGPDFIEMPALHAKLDGLASQSDDLVDEPLRKKVRMKEKLTAKNIINGAAAIFQDLSVVGDTGSSGHASGSLIQNQDQDLYIMLSSFPNGFKEFILGQFEHMTQLLRHFYAFFVMKSSWNDSTIILKMKKILNLLEDKLNSISAYKKELQARPSAGSDAELLRFEFRCINEVIKPIHEAMDSWEKTCCEKGISSK